MATLSSAGRVIEELNPDLIVVDPSESDARLQKIMSQQGNGALLVALVPSPTSEWLQWAMELGARGFLAGPLSESGALEADSLLMWLDRGRKEKQSTRIQQVESIQKLKQQVQELKERYIQQSRSFNESQDVFYLDLSRMITIIDNIRDGIIFTDPDGQVTLMNPIAEELLGVKPIVGIGKQLEEQGSGELVGEIALDQRVAMIEGGVSERTLEIHHTKRDLVYLKLRTTAVTDYKGSFAGILTVIKDVTAEYKSDQMKNQYLSIVSHELRTPLTGIKTFATLLAKGALGELPSSQQKCMDSIREQTLRLEHEVDKLICLGRIESGDFAMDLEIFPVSELLDLVTMPFKQIARDRDIDLVLRLPEVSPMIEADREDLRRALQALVENAIKFTPNGGQVEISVEELEWIVRIHVKDDGPGVDPRYHRRIFEKFFQVEDPLTRHHGGAGLGLSVAQGVAEAHGGTIEVVSEISEGADFITSLPKCVAEAFEKPTKG
ncbi:MAG: ATP-binding protein [Planctomycetota bacterium]